MFHAAMLEKRLFALQDKDYRAFHCRLIPTIDPETVIGVRTPALRAFAKEYAKESESSDFLQALPHRYYEENNLHGFLIEQMRDYAECIRALDAFLPYVDNWATCDLMRPKALKRHLPEFRTEIRRYLASKETYTVRFGIEMLMTFYLGDRFSPDDFVAVAAVRSEEYYINMMVAWYFATALAKRYEAALPYLTERRLPLWTHNKTIQKAVESNRISAECKAFLRTLRQKP